MYLRNKKLITIFLGLLLIFVLTLNASASQDSTLPESYSIPTQYVTNLNFVLLSQSEIISVDA